MSNLSKRPDVAEILTKVYGHTFKIFHDHPEMLSGIGTRMGSQPNTFSTIVTEDHPEGHDVYNTFADWIEKVGIANVRSLQAAFNTTKSGDADMFAYRAQPIKITTRDAGSLDNTWLAATALALDPLKWKEKSLVPKKVAGSMVQAYGDIVKGDFAGYYSPGEAKALIAMIYLAYERAPNYRMVWGYAKDGKHPMPITVVPKGVVKAIPRDFRIESNPGIVEIARTLHDYMMNGGRTNAVNVGAPALNPMQQAKADTEYLKPYINPSQLRVMFENVAGEEGEWFRDKLSELVKTIKAHPRTYDTNSKEESDIWIKLHYFTPSGDAYITELDRGAASNNDADQAQAYGYVKMNGDLEGGYVSIQEWIANRAELDLHFKPITLEDLKFKESGRDAPVPVAVSKTPSVPSEADIRGEDWDDDAPVTAPVDLSGMTVSGPKDTGTYYTREQLDELKRKNAYTVNINSRDHSKEAVRLHGELVAAIQGTLRFDVNKPGNAALEDRIIDVASDTYAYYSALWSSINSDAFTTNHKKWADKYEEIVRLGKGKNGDKIVRFANTLHILHKKAHEYASLLDTSIGTNPRLNDLGKIPDEIWKLVDSKFEGMTAEDVRYTLEDALDILGIAADAENNLHAYSNVLGDLAGSYEDYSSLSDEFSADAVDLITKTLGIELGDFENMHNDYAYMKEEAEVNFFKVDYRYGGGVSVVNLPTKRLGDMTQAEEDAYSKVKPAVKPSVTAPVDVATDTQGIPDNETLTGRASTLLKIAHRVFGRGVEYRSVKNGYESLLKDISTGIGNNGGVKYTIKPKEMKRLKEELEGYRHDLQLFADPANRASTRLAQLTKSVTAPVDVSGVGNPLGDMTQERWTRLGMGNPL